MQAFQVAKIARPAQDLVQRNWVEITDEDGSKAMGWVAPKTGAINVVTNPATLDSQYAINPIDCRETCAAALALFN